MMTFYSQLSTQRKQLEDELKKVEEQKAAIEKQLLLLRSGFKDVTIAPVSN